ncbi:MAG: class I SAM-dependent methyltransferase [Bacteroidota bacterium]
MNTPKENSQLVNNAFSAQAPLFDGIQHSSPMLEWMRSVVHRHVDALLKTGDTIVDINAGTGIDALHFAQLGYTVHAMDLAGGMVEQIRKKISEHRLEERVTTEQRSFAEAGGLAPRKFDHIFSNFGGLNCVPDLCPIAEQLATIIKPGGLITMVIMPKICPWEILHLLRGNTDIGLRRLHKDGVIAHIEGHHFRTYYFSVNETIRAFGDSFSVVSIRGVASCSPPPTMEKFPKHFPRIYSFLQSCDERLSLYPPFNRWADQFILTLRYNGH